MAIFCSVYEKMVIVIIMTVLFFILFVSYIYNSFFWLAHNVALTLPKFLEHVYIPKYST